VGRGAARGPDPDGRTRRRRRRLHPIAGLARAPRRPGGGGAAVAAGARRRGVRRRAGRDGRGGPGRGRDGLARRPHGRAAGAGLTRGRTAGAEVEGEAWVRDVVHARLTAGRGPDGLGRVATAVAAGELSPFAAADRLLAAAGPA